ncbi:MAG: AmmeMemoRadiSam system protein B, partial [Phycisphaerae bacterium]|nr:AmmeMemoRadiSam system protein B [Phycisphaerae bacterium]
AAMERRALGAIVPHAGWICSGAIAGQSIAALASTAGRVDLVVVFGAIHTPIRIDRAALDIHDAWATPLRLTDVAPELAAEAIGGSQLFVRDERLHRREHAVEVELPLIETAWPGVPVLPVEVPVDSCAVQIGEQTARLCQRHGLSVVFLASSDLTHYGPDYDFAPAGLGPQALDWAKENDRRLLALVTEMRAEAIVPEVKLHQNACGGGAIAAMLAACRYLGASRATVLRHANSCETLAELRPQPPVNAVGYAAVVVTD